MKINRNYAIAFIILLMIEVLIAVFVHDRFIRPYIGDVLVVILIYCGIKVFVTGKIKLLPLYIFLGRFSRNGGDIWWIGSKTNENLNQLHKILCYNLGNQGFILEKRELIPHLTIAREVKLNDTANQNLLIKSPEMHVAVDKISFMKSERIKGILSYTEIYRKTLK